MNLKTEPNLYRKVEISVRKISTGETRQLILNEDHRLLNRIGLNYPPFDTLEDHTIYYMLAELEYGEWSCDCNRSVFFDEFEFGTKCTEVEYAVDWFSVNDIKYISENNYGDLFRQEE